MRHGNCFPEEKMLVSALNYRKNLKYAQESWDIVNEVGPFGEFVSHENTYRNMRITSRPKLIDRRCRDDWRSRGACDLYQWATEEARHSLETHKPPDLPDSVRVEISGIIREAEAEPGLRDGEGKGR
jgi:trimethylamine:corrinoid methyltransferase-like protein